MNVMNTPNPLADTKEHIVEDMRLTYSAPVISDLSVNNQTAFGPGPGFDGGITRSSGNS